MKNRIRVGAIAAAAAVVSALAVAQVNVTPARSAEEAGKAIAARQELFKEIKKAHDPLGAMLKRQREVDPAVVATSAKRIQELAGQIPAAYAVDTRAFPGTKTEAGQNIWGGMADFTAKSDALAKAAGETASLAAAGNAADTLKGIVAMSKTCGGCHDSYRTK